MPSQFFSAWHKNIYEHWFAMLSRVYLYIYLFDPYLYPLEKISMHTYVYHPYIICRWDIRFKM